MLEMYRLIDCLILIAFLAHHSVFARDLTDRMTVSATVISSCNINSNEPASKWSCSKTPSTNSETSTIKSTTISVSDNKQYTETTQVNTLIIYNVDF